MTICYRDNHLTREFHSQHISIWVRALTEQTKTSDSIDLPETDIHQKITELAEKIVKEEP